MNKRVSYIELTDKERAVLWVIACWFERPIVTSSLKAKLHKHENDALAKKYDSMIINRIIVLGKWLESKQEKDEL